EHLSRIEKLDREGLASHPSRDRLANQGGKIGPQSEEGTVLVQKPVSLVPELGSQSVRERFHIVEKRENDLIEAPVFHDRRQNRLHLPAPVDFFSKVTLHALRNHGPEISRSLHPLHTSPTKNF